jgi:LPPG:FO 2-phospho-L-lactate transferase
MSGGGTRTRPRVGAGSQERTASTVVLAGGTGGAKLARGMLDVVGPEALTVIANTADDVEIHGAYVSPDPDLCLFWLADRIDERGWGLRDDTFAVMDGLRELGVEVWFSLGDRDLAIGVRRAERLREGARLTEALLELGAALGVGARVLPMADAPVRTWVRARGAWTPFQRFMIVDGAAGPIEGVELRGIEHAAPSPEALEAIAAADAIVVGPSNPVISIRPILDVPGMADALRAARAPVVAVSPIVAGTVVKGPTEPFMAWAGLPLDADGVAAYYGELLDGIVADETATGLPSLRTDTLMADAAARRRVAAQTLDFALALA